jgi:hypothetical protein
MLHRFYCTRPNGARDVSGEKESVDKANRQIMLIINK